MVEVGDDPTYVVSTASASVLDEEEGDRDECPDEALDQAADSLQSGTDACASRAVRSCADDAVGSNDPAVEPSQLSELAQLAELPEKNPDPVGRLARDATVQMANAAARQFLGREDIVGLCWVDLCPGMTWGRLARRSLMPSSSVGLAGH